MARLPSIFKGAMTTACGSCEPDPYQYVAEKILEAYKRYEQSADA